MHSQLARGKTAVSDTYAGPCHPVAKPIRPVLLASYSRSTVMLKHTMTSRSFVPKGAASFRVAYDRPPRDVYFLLLPKLTLLAFTSALEPLRVANQVAGRELYRWYVMTGDGGPVTCSCGVNITPDGRLGDIPRDALAFVCAGIEPTETVSPRATR